MINTLERSGPSGSYRSDARWPTAILSRREEADVNRAICTTLILARSWPINTQWMSVSVAASIYRLGRWSFLFRVLARNRGTDEVRTRRVGRKMSARGIRRKKSSLSEVKVAVIGAPSVGKSGTFSAVIIYYYLEKLSSGVTVHCWKLKIVSSTFWILAVIFCRG